MRFATLGTSPEACHVVSVLLELGHEWIAAVGRGVTFGPEVTLTSVPGETLASWEDLFQLTRLDMLVVAVNPGEDRDEPLRKLVQSLDARLLLLHPACEAIVAIELEMIRDDVGTVVASYCPSRCHPAFVALADIRRGQGATDIGAIQQIVMERSLPERTDVNVIWNLRRDCELLRTLAGEIRHVNAMGESGKGAGFSNLSVNMTPSGDNVVVRWSMSPGDSSARITLIGEHGKAKLEIGDSQYELDVNGETETFEPQAGAGEALALLAASEAPTPDWTQIRRALEVAEAAERSAVKGKTVELYDESYTEESSFKGAMAIGGCGLLLLTLLFILAWSIVESVRFPYLRNEHDRLQVERQGDGSAVTETEPQSHLLIRLWPVYPFAAFLLLQTLRLVFHDPAKRDPSRSKDGDHGAPVD